MAGKVKGKTKSGFEFSIDSDVFKDWRFLRVTRKASTTEGEEQFNASMEMVALLFNDETEEEKFYSDLAEKNGGRVPVDVVGHEVGEIMKIVQEKSKEAKN